MSRGERAELVGNQDPMLEAPLIFDGRCGFCTKSVRLIKALDRRGRLALAPYQRSGVAESAGLTLEECRAAAWLITCKGDRYRGAGAIAAALSVALRNWLPYKLYELPLMRPLQDRVYDWVASHRRIMPGETAYCSRHPEECSQTAPQGAPHGS